MEDKATFYKIAILSKDERLTESVMLRLQKHSDSSIILLANQETNGTKNVEQSMLFLEDVTLLDQQLSSVEVVIYIDDMLHKVSNESMMVKRLSNLANLINVCIENQTKKLIFISGFTPSFGSHYNTSINENTIWESSMNLDVNSKYIHLAQHEVNRGINEGLSCSILSCGHLVNHETMKSQKALIQNLLDSGASSFQFVDIADVIDLIELTVCANHTPTKMLLIGECKTKIELSHLIGYRPNFIKRIVQFFKGKKNSAIEISIANTLTLDFYQKAFRKIDLSTNL